jgi:exopolysaccharide biosynthesis WecB/TagA/CpsF family protein
MRSERARPVTDAPSPAPTFVPPPTTRLGGLTISVQTLAEAAETMISQALARRAGGRALYVTSANGHVLSMCALDAQAKALIEAADMVHADGQPMVSVSRRRGTLPLPERVATTDLVHVVFAQSAARGVRHYLLGATRESNEKARAALAERYPGVEIHGRDGYFDDPEPVLADIARVRPDILWVGFGAPAEQRFVVRHLDRLACGCVKTSGGLFDFLSGANARAPLWMQKVGLEWAFRLALEPKRLGWRYLTTNPHALYLLLTRG